MTESIISALIFLCMLALPLYIFLTYSKLTVLGALSLPCFTALISLIYFFIIPFIVSFDPMANYLGIYLSDTPWRLMAVNLYLAGAGAAFFLFRRTLQTDFVSWRPIERRYNERLFLWVVILIGLGILYLFYDNKLNVLGDADFQLDVDAMQNYAFVNVVFNMSVALCLVFMIKRRFDVFSLFVMFVLLWFLLQTGFRYRILILLASAATAFFAMRGVRIDVMRTLLGATAAVFGANLLGSIRRYGQGLDADRLQDVQLGQFFTHFSGEAGIAFVTDYVTNHDLPEPVLWEPWVVGLARLIPSFLWENKPYPSYLNNIVAGATTHGAERAGAAAPQQVEMLFQFGWLGLPVLAFVYFGIAIFLLSKLNKLGREARIAGFAMAPVYFGFYMQSRGYFSQILSDGIFFFLPLFLIHWRDTKFGTSAPAPAEAGPDPQHGPEAKAEMRV